MKPVQVLAWCFIAIAATVPPALAQPNGGDRIGTITPLSGDLYRVDAGGQTTVFIVGSEGIVLVDPLSTEVATWLRDEFAMRFPGRPVRYVVYSHHHEDRASGGLVFMPSASQVGQGRFNAERLAASTTLSPPLADFDRNRDGVLQRDEISQSSRAATLLARDRNADGILTPSEIYAEVATVDSAFSRQGTLTVGAPDVLLASAPTSYAADMNVIVFPAQRVAFAANLFTPRAVPRQFGPQKVPVLIESMRTIERLPFDTLLTGDGQMLNRSDVASFREYLEALYGGVRSGRAAGRTIGELQNELSLDSFRQWDNFENGRRVNIAEVYQALRRSVVTLTATGAYPYESADSCNRQPGCVVTDGHATPVGVEMRRIGERFTAAMQMHSFPRESAHYPTTSRVVQLQDTIVALPLGVAVGSAERGMSIIVEGGPAISRGRSGVTTFGRFSDEFRATSRVSVGWSAGALVEFHVRPRLAIAAPVHFVQEGTDATSVRRRRIMVGAGLSVGIQHAYR